MKKKSYIVGIIFIVFNLSVYISEIVCNFTGTKHLWGNPEIYREPYVLKNTCAFIFWILLIWFVYECIKSRSRLVYVLPFCFIIEIHRVLFQMGELDEWWFSGISVHQILYKLFSPFFAADLHLMLNWRIWTMSNGQPLPIAYVIRIVFSIILFAVSVHGVKKLKKIEKSKA